MCCVSISSCTDQDWMPSKICKAILPCLSSTMHAHIVTQLACALQQHLCYVLHDHVYSALGESRTLQRFVCIVACICLRHCQKCV